ncbi:proline iminopeptidase-family hydrolase [Nocardiopsis kunsanensis]|uniref:proline iminopeptidase-family hydrolase n=1 Tax=Nocardiopsis kunsanensis TaxID=141693 RepID=UPI00034BEA94|nr:proline iminopeptidase-family hydrolase [Nocardiopsis kunsanensis]
MSTSPTSGRYHEVPGGRVWCELLNPDAPGTPVVTVHGGPGTPHDYLRPVAGLLPGHPVLVYDQLGCGRSDAPSDDGLWELPRFVDELEEVTRAQGLDRFHLLAHSFGTMIACDLALRGSLRLESLVLLSPVLSVRRYERDVQELLMGLPPNVAGAITGALRGGPDGPERAEAFLHFAERHMCRREPWPDELVEASARTSVRVRDTMWGPTEFQISGNLRSYHRIEQLRDIDTPTLLMCGEYDFTSPKVCRAYARSLAHGRVAVIPNASHNAHLEEPEECADHLGGFLDTVTESVQT